MTRKPKVKMGGYSIMDMLVVAGSKVGTERLLSGFVGNGTLTSGVVKGALAVGIPYVSGNNKMARLASLGISVDAIEDIMNGVLGGNALGGVFGGSQVQRV